MDIAPSATAEISPTAVPFLAGAHVVVTGAAGFIGGHLVRALLASDPARIVAIDSRIIGRASRTSASRTELVYSHRSIRAPLDDLLDHADIVFHLAAHVSVPQSIEYPLSDLQVNASGTIMLLESCRRARVRRVVYSSSAAVYGAPKYLPVDECHPTNPQSPYGLSKLTAERYCLLYGQLYELSVVALRYFNVYGPNQQRNGGYAAVIPKFLDRVQRNLPLVVEGDGSQTRDFVHVADVAAANVLAGGARFEGVLNVGSGQATSIIELAQLVGGPDYPIEHGPQRLGDIPHSVADARAARDFLGFRVTIPLALGLVTLRRRLGKSE